MSDFAREFLRDRVDEATHPRGYLALFGKHPGWDDHVEDLPLATSSLVLAKQNLYIQGIGGQVSSGGWARLGEAQSLPGFDHVILWNRGSQFIAGRLWSSTDGKRRAHFPMVAMVHCIGVPVRPSLGAIVNWLATVEAACKATRSAERIRSLFEQCQGDFQGWLSRAELGAMDDGISVDWGITPDQLVPAIAEIQRRCGDLTARRFKERSQLGSSHFRVPATGTDQAHDLRLWNRLLSRTLHGAVPIMLAAARNQRWIDIIAGEPAASDYLSFRATDRAIPIISASVGEGENHAGAENIVRTCLDPSIPVLEEPELPQSGGWFSRLLTGKEPGR